jgi:hypothetical protein
MNSSPNDHCFAYVKFSGLFDPAKLSDKIGLPATKFWAAGDTHPITKQTRKFSMWKLESRLPHSAEVEEHVGDVLAQLAGRLPQVKMLAEEFNGVMQLVCRFKEWTAGIHFDSKLLAAIAASGLEIDIDEYFTREDREAIPIEPPIPAQ